MAYNRLVKKIKSSDDGAEMLACAYFDTPQCRIHNIDSCNTCKVFAAIINQLYQFECAYCGGEKEGDDEANNCSANAGDTS